LYVKLQKMQQKIAFYKRPSLTRLKQITNIPNASSFYLYKKVFPQLPSASFSIINSFIVFTLLLESLFNFKIYPSFYLSINNTMSS
jgi:hypothetical protein